MSRIPAVESGLLGCLTAILFLATGCANTVILTSPRHQDRAQVDSAPGPNFDWATLAPLDNGRRYEFTLTVARDPSFSNPVFQQERIEKSSLKIETEKGWLPGGSEYHWKVEGVGRDEDGEVVETLLCDKPRSFFIEPRDAVAIDLKLPEAEEISDVRVIVGDEEFTSNSSFEMEEGETRTLSLSFQSEGETIRVGGRIAIVGYNENTEFGKIIIENFDVTELTAISKGEVGNYTYQLGGDEIVKVTLGSRTRDR